MSVSGLVAFAKPLKARIPAGTVIGWFGPQPPSTAGSVPLNGVTVTAACRSPDEALWTIVWRMSRRPVRASTIAR
jgi:hypothetical protein